MYPSNAQSNFQEALEEESDLYYKNITSSPAFAAIEREDLRMEMLRNPKSEVAFVLEGEPSLEDKNGNVNYIVSYLDKRGTRVEAEFAISTEGDLIMSSATSASLQQSKPEIYAELSQMAITAKLSLQFSEDVAEQLANVYSNIRKSGVFKRNVEQKLEEYIGLFRDANFKEQEVTREARLTGEVPTVPLYYAEDISHFVTVYDNLRESGMDVASAKAEVLQYMDTLRLAEAEHQFDRENVDKLQQQFEKMDVKDLRFFINFLNNHLYPAITEDFKPGQAEKQLLQLMIFYKALDLRNPGGKSSPEAQLLDFMQAIATAQTLAQEQKGGSLNIKILYENMAKMDLKNIRDATAYLKSTTIPALQQENANIPKIQNDFVEKLGNLKADSFQRNVEWVKKGHSLVTPGMFGLKEKSARKAPHARSAEESKEHEAEEKHKGPSPKG